MQVDPEEANGAVPVNHDSGAGADVNQSQDNPRSEGQDIFNREDAMRSLEDRFNQEFDERESGRYISWQDHKLKVYLVDLLYILSHVRGAGLHEAARPPGGDKTWSGNVNRLTKARVS